jgi:NDP-sugar pyrophosphorylase family protein
MNKTVVIPAAGTGSRLGEYTQNYNKAMCTLGSKPVISYIIEKFDDSDELIILLGYKGDLLKQVINMCYPTKNIKFVSVDKYEGEGSGLGYSLLCARDLLQKPFIFWSNDTVISDDISTFDYNENWILMAEKDTYETSNNAAYRHGRLSQRKERVYSILPKGDFDESGMRSLPYIGISFIKDFEAFWKAADINRDVFINGGESIGINNINGFIKAYFTSTWIDTGNKVIFEKYKKLYNQNMEETILEKPDEAIWFIGNRVVKFHLDEKFIADRVKRVNTMINSNMEENGFTVPEIIDYDKNIYVMEKCKGVTLSKIINPVLFKELIEKYFNAVELYNNNEDDELKKSIYKDFYYEKTIKRIKDYCKKFEDSDKDDFYINGLKCKSAISILDNILWDKFGEDFCKLSENYHGDFHLENIMYDEETNKFILLDWRQNFGKTDIGDLYYDIAKMWHSLIVNHNMVKDDLFSIKYVDTNSVEIDIHRTFIDTECEEVLKKYLIENANYNNDFSQFLTAVIFLNIAACHVYPYSKFLFYLGKYLINKCDVIQCYNVEEADDN